MLPGSASKLRRRRRPESWWGRMCVAVPAPCAASSIRLIAACARQVAAADHVAHPRRHRVQRTAGDHARTGWPLRLATLASLCAARAFRPCASVLWNLQVIAFAQVPGAVTATRSIVGRSREKLAAARRRLFKPTAPQPFPHQHDVEPATASAIAAALRDDAHASPPPPRARGRHPMFRLAFTVRLLHNNNNKLRPQQTCPSHTPSPLALAHS